MISFQDFQELSTNYNTIPLVESSMADLHTPVSVYLALRKPESYSFLFESAEPDEKVGRYSFIGIDPLMMVQSLGSRIDVVEKGVRSKHEGSVFALLEQLASRFRQPDSTHPAGLSGGFVGYFGYDCIRHIEKVPLHEATSLDEKDALFGLFATIVRFDHREQLVTIIHNVIVDRSRSLREQYDEGKQRVQMIGLRLRNTALSMLSFSCRIDNQAVSADKGWYCAAVEKAKRYITEGDIFQVVLSRKLRLPFSGDPFPVYRALRYINPSPYLFYIDFGETKLVGSSPEILLRVQNREVEVLPIAGTRRRGSSEREDHELESELLGDTKELAEHVMLVDLGRNDVGRISTFGSVRVPVFKKVERYSHVMHIVSEVHGTLRDDATPVDALKACFPAGTVSGAPKVRAMEIIHELEPARRGAYAGAVGYLGFNGTLDTCIGIRTIVVHKEMLSIQSGAGIVADSVPETEFQETVNKAQALLDAVRMAANGLSLSSPEPVREGTL
jgi:anthranilate synthase component 1